MRTGALRLIWSNPKTSQNPSNLKPCGEIFLFGMFAQTLLLFLIFDSLSKNLGSASIDSVFDPCHVHVIEILAHRHICLAFVGWAMKHDFFFNCPQKPGTERRGLSHTRHVVRTQGSGLGLQIHAFCFVQNLQSVGIDPVLRNDPRS